MKIFSIVFAIITAALLASCVSVKPPEPSSEFYAFDYSEVSSTYGVGFTESDAVNFEYDALASVSVFDNGGYVESKSLKQKENNATTESSKSESRFLDDGIYASTPKKKSVNGGRYIYVKPDAQKGLASLAKLANALGGDYVLNLKIQHSYEVEDGYAYGRYILSGMVVKKK